jgi:hypothetical protein
VLIAQNKTFWIHDFGGGFTDGWVSPEFFETEKSDLEGLEKLEMYLKNGSIAK